MIWVRRIFLITTGIVLASVLTASMAFGQTGPCGELRRGMRFLYDNYGEKVEYMAEAFGRAQILVFLNRETRTFTIGVVAGDNPVKQLCFVIVGREWVQIGTEASE